MRIWLFMACLMPLLLFAQEYSIDLFDAGNLQLINTEISEVKLEGKKALKAVQADPEAGYSLVMISDIILEDGVIEVDLAGAPSPGAPDFSRGFVGIAFRTSEDQNMYECFYLRATNARANDQLRRNHTVQYMSIPGYEWNVLRDSFPGKYESYVDMEPAKWTQVKIEFSGKMAKLFVHGSDQPALVINDLKQGEKQGAIGLWVGPATDTYYRKLKIYKK